VLDRNARRRGMPLSHAKIWDKAGRRQSAVKLDSTTLESRKILSVIYFNARLCGRGNNLKQSL